MTILYKICLYEDRLQKHGICRISDSTENLVFTCLTSVLRQMTDSDEIVFFCDGDNCVNKLKNLCIRFKINYKLLTFNYKSASKINHESLTYIKSNQTHDHIYICEDDYLHFDGALDKIKEFLNKYPGYFCHPIDYPNLYETDKRFVYESEIILTETLHWRSIKSTTYTIAFNRSLYEEHKRTFDIIKDSVFDEHGINLLYVFNKCYSPIPTLTSHITNGCIPYIIDTKKTYDENYENYNKLNL